MPVLTSEARDDVTLSAPQVGKTFAAQCWLLSAAWMGGRSINPWWWVAPTYPQARHGFQGLVAMARSSGVLARSMETPTPRCWLVNGAYIEARSWEKPAGVFGPTVRGAVIDEFARLTWPAYHALSSRRAETVSRGEGFYRYLGNVGELGGPAEEIWVLAESGQAGFEHRRWTWRDRAAAHECYCDFPQPDWQADKMEILEQAGKHTEMCPRGEYLKFIRFEAARLSDPQFRRLYEAEWADWSELPVYQFDRQVHVRDAYAEYQEALPVELSCDFNVDPMVWTLGQSKGKRGWTYREIVIEGGATTKEACREFMRLHPKRETHVIVTGDASGNAGSTKSKTSDYQQMRKILGKHYLTFEVRVPRANPAVSARINSVNAMLAPADGSEPRWYVHSRCRQLITDRARVSYKPGTREIDKSNKKRTHASDADDYRWVKRFPVKGAPVPQPQIIPRRPDPILDMGN